MVKIVATFKIWLLNTEREVKKIINKDEGMEKVDKADKIEDIKDDEIMTVGKVAAYFKVGEDTALKLVKDGRG